VTAKFKFGDEANGISREITGDHEGDIISDEKHDQFPPMLNV